MTPELESKIREWHRVSEGWTTFPQLLELAEFILFHKPTIVCEVGTFGARHAVTIAMAMREVDHGKIYTIDPMRLEHAIEGENDANREWWKNNVDLGKIHQYAMNAIWQYDLEKWCVVIRAASQYCYELFPKINILLVDGDHAEIPALRDVVNYLPSVVTGGLIYFDDSDWPSTHKAIKVLDDSCTLVKDGGDYRVYRKK